MFCFLYKSLKKEGVYLYIPRKDDFSEVPDVLLQMFDKPVFMMVIKMEKHKLPKIKKSLASDGYFLQVVSFVPFS
ncbi:YcgL domain-containing protein [Candidatus Photodesmus blepharus]|uniref:YcgL domain-containing protein n=1 Tax=Candidatus Photodesmus blepharonis TaxID=1179155 RepID=UPI000555C901|nr:YcgL domain-containing protein [Candidatus Photodesmus blepharus]